MKKTPIIHCSYDELIPLDELKPHPRNPNTHPTSQIRLLAKVITDTGWRAPITVSNRSGFVTRGHGRLLAAQHAGWETAPVDRQDYNSVEEELADLLADNKLAELSELSSEAVSSILQEIDNPNLAGYQQKEVDLLLRSVEVAAHVRKPKEVALPKSKPEKLQEKYATQHGQLWTSPEGHVLYIGDACDESTWNNLGLLGQTNLQADMIFTDPPYGVSYEGGSGLTIENDDLDESGLERLLSESLGYSFQSLKEGGSIYCCCPGGDLHHLFISALRQHNALRQTIIWAKDQFVLGRQDYHWRHEPILYGWKPGAAHYYAPGDRTQDTVWEINTIEQDTIWKFPRPKRSEEHPTMKPVELVARAIANSTRVGEIILDPFSGSGSTALAAAQLSRKSISIELDPCYAAVIIERLASIGIHLHIVE